MELCKKGTFLLISVAEFNQVASRARFFSSSAVDNFCGWCTVHIMLVNFGVPKKTTEGVPV